MKHTYTLDGANILRETWCENELIPLYDNAENVCGIIYNDTPFYFQKNLQGDIIAIANAYGQIVARYNYDAWGVCTIESDCSGVNIAEVNPYRYRGYYYDAEIGLYYVFSRYYDAQIGRFLNSDEFAFALISANVLQKNLFAYCNNDSVNTKDERGYLSARLISAIVCGIVNAIFDVIIQLFVTFIAYYKNNKKRKGNPKYSINWLSVTLSAINGALGGLVMASRAKRIIQCIGGGVINALSGLILNIRSKNFRSVLCNFIIDFTIGALWGALSGDGLANKYYVKGLLVKGYYAYNGLRYTTASFQMNKVVFKEFAKAMWYFFATCFSNLVKNVVGAVV